MINIKSPAELSVMKEGGHKLGIILDRLLDEAQPGVSLKKINQSAEKYITETGGSASFKTIANYQWAACLCVNDVIVHGIPTDYKIKDGDLLTIDAGLLYEGFHTDTAWTKIVGAKARKDKENFLKAGETALKIAIGQAVPGNRIGNISQVIQETIEGSGYSVVRSLVGHGVGKKLHEEPQVPGYLNDKIENTPFLKEGMTLAIEVIYCQKQADVVYKNDDGWSIATRDGSLSAVFEHTIAITHETSVVLTKAEN